MSERERRLEARLEQEKAGAAPGRVRPGNRLPHPEARLSHGFRLGWGRKQDQGPSTTLGT